MCKWNPPDRRCTHGHTEHEELYNPHERYHPPVIWCNACWTVCAFYSDKNVRKGVEAAISDAFNGTTRAPPYITLCDEPPEGKRQRPSGAAVQKSTRSPNGSRIGPESQFGTIPSMQERAYAQATPMNTTGQVIYPQFSPATPMEDEPQIPPEVPDVQEGASGPMQNHNLARYQKFEEEYEGLR